MYTLYVYIVCTPTPFQKGDRESSKSFLNGEGVIIDKGIKKGISIVTSVFTF